MPKIGFIALDRLRVTEASKTEGGTFFLRKRGPGDGCRLVVGDVPNHSQTWYIHLQGERGFVLNAASTNEDLWCAVPSWRLVVDPASATSPFEDMAKPGDVFLSGDTLDMVGKFNGSTAYLALTGGSIRELQWERYVGFRHWRIVSDDCEGVEPVVLFEYGASSTPRPAGQSPPDIGAQPDRVHFAIALRSNCGQTCLRSTPALFDHEIDRTNRLCGVLYSNLRLAIDAAVETRAGSFVPTDGISSREAPPPTSRTPTMISNASPFTCS